MGLGDFLNNVVNSIPVVGHVKGAVHGLLGDEEGAEKAIESANSCTSGILNSIPVVGHVKGAVHGLLGDEEGAEKAIKAANSCTSGVLNSIPVVGHAKGLVHNIVGDHEGAKKAYLSATRSTLVLGGGAVGSLTGPGGAAAYAASFGALMDMVVSTATKEPVGFIRNLDTITGAKDVTDVIVGVGKMGLEIGLDAAAGASMGGALDLSAQLPTKQMMKSTPNQILRSAPMAPHEVVMQSSKQISKQAVKQTSKQITREVGKKVANKVATNPLEAIVAQSVVKSTLKNGRLKAFKPNVEYEPPSSDSTASDDDDEEYIYFFRCLDGTLKVGRTRHIRNRLNTHRLSGKISYDSYITVYECSNSVQAETLILQDGRIREARINRTEFLDSSIVDEEYVLIVITATVTLVNGPTEPTYFRLSSIDHYFP